VTTPITPINLIPLPRVRRKRLRARIRWWGVGLATYVAALVVFFGVRLAGRTVAIPPDPAIQEQRMAQLSSDLAKASKHRDDARMRHAATLMLAGRPDWSVLLPLLGRSMGDEVVLKELKLVQSKDQTARQYGLEMRGVARTSASAANFVTKLEETGLFDDVRLLRTGREPFLAESMVNFDVLCRLSDAPPAGGVR
jgi:Tfp pilus assembly protein PilN